MLNSTALWEPNLSMSFCGTRGTPRRVSARLELERATLVDSISALLKGTCSPPAPAAGLRGAAGADLPPARLQPAHELHCWSTVNASKALSSQGRQHAPPTGPLGAPSMPGCCQACARGSGFVTSWYRSPRVM